MQDSISADELTLPSYDGKEDLQRHILWAPRKKRAFRRVTPARGERPVPKCRKRLLFEFDLEREAEEGSAEAKVVETSCCEEVTMKSVPQTPEPKKCESREVSLEKRMPLIPQLRKQRSETPNCTRFDPKVKIRKLSLLSGFR